MVVQKSNFVGTNRCPNCDNPVPFRCYWWNNLGSPFVCPSCGRLIKASFAQILWMCLFAGLLMLPSIILENPFMLIGSLVLVWCLSLWFRFRCTNFVLAENVKQSATGGEKIPFRDS